MERDLTTGSIGRNILKFSLPYFLSYFLQTLYGIADLFIIGQFNGVASTTAVSIGSQVMHMITVMIVGIAMGTTVMIGKSVGAKQKKETSKIIGLFESPNPLKMELMILYAVIKGIPAKHMVKYAVVPSTACCGVDMIRTIG